MPSQEKTSATFADGAVKKGSAHPITAIISEIAEIFTELGYTIANGPEMETEYYNFDALNIPEHHPAREMWDTFWIKDHPNTLLRTHTSPMQVRYMEKHQPPIKIIIPGKVFRNEATDATHEAQFHQVEGLCVTEQTNLAEMKGVLEEMLRRLFGDDLMLRYRPSLFPFTEPSLEVDMRRSEDADWVEILGCGMVHQQVLSRVGIDPRKYQGFAFGMGVDRIAMLRYNFGDVRLLNKPDLRLINQF